MPLAPGVRLGPYEIVSPIGAGGMGEVYRARDTRLDRAVAIKVLPEQFAADPQLRERFDREARAISSLNHPNICALYDLGREQDIDFLVMEYLDGETLADRLAATPLRVDDALRYAVQIADALDRAHRSGIVHRDLKPANVMLTKSGAKLLDFGLAKSAAPAIATSGLSMLPTTPPNLTAHGTILGTFQYMAPEQIEGLEADARTDIFAFGALLFEMLTGRTAFQGKTRAQLLGAILKDDPPPVSTLQPLAPKAIDRIVATCLAKDPDDRWQTARDLVRELKWAIERPAAEGGVPAGGAAAERAASAPASARLAWIIAAVAVIAFAAAAAIALRHIRESPPAAEVLQFTIPGPDNAQFGGPVGGGTGAGTQLAVSPDGRHVAFIARTSATYSLWVRSMASLATRQIAGTDNASFPFWSPDSRFIGYFASGKLKKVQLSGGPPITLCDSLQGRGGSWNRDGVIVFGQLSSGLLRVSANGGIPAPIVALDKAYGETSHRWPHFLPDGKHFLYTAVTGAAGAAPRPSRVKIAGLDDAAPVTIFDGETSAQYAFGHILTIRETTLMAQPFDANSRQLSGDPFPVAEQVGSEGSRYVSFSTAPTGVLVYAHGSLMTTSRLAWFDRTGREIGNLGEAGTYLSVALSPDDRRVAVSLATGSPPNIDVWTIDAARGITSRLTFDPGQDSSPTWSPDSERVVFASLRQGGSALFQKMVRGTADEELLLKGPSMFQLPIPTDWSRDGRFVAYETGAAASLDIWAAPVAGGKPVPVVQGPAADTRGVFSPDGKWFAYAADESGMGQVYVIPFPSPSGRFQISKDGGTQPLWRADGKELFFLAPDGMLMTAAVATSGRVEALPRPLFQAGVSVPGRRQYAVTSDGKRFLMLVPRSSDRNASATPLTVVVNWLAAVQK